MKKQQKKKHSSREGIPGRLNARSSKEHSLQKSKTEKTVAGAVKKFGKKIIKKSESIPAPAGDTGKLNLSDILDINEIQLLMNELHKIVNIPMAIIDLKGKVLVGVGWQDICTKYHRVNPETCQYCIESDTKLSIGVAYGNFRIYKCKNGLWDISTPIIIGGENMGNLFTGQLLFDDETPDYDFFRSQAKKYGFNEQEYISSLEKVPRFSRDYINRVMSFFLKFADMLSKLSLRNIEQAGLLKERDALTDSLQESEMRLNKAQEIAHLGSWELDLEKNRLTWSDEVYRIFGLEPQEFEATYETFIQAIHPDDRKAVDEAYSGSLREGRDAYEIEHRIVRKLTKEVRFVYEKCEHIRNDSGEIIRSIGMVHDITDTKAARKHIDYLAKFPAENPNPVLRVNAENVIIYANNPAKRVLDEWKTGIDGQMPPKIWKSIKTSISGCAQQNIEVKHGDKTLMFAIAPIKDAGYANLYGSDITALKEAEYILLKDKTMQEKIIKERTARLNEAQIKVAHLSRLSDIGTLSATIAHELRNPLATIKTAVYNIKRKTGNPENLERHFVNIQKKISESDQIINNLLFYSRLKAPEFCKTDVSKLITDCIEDTLNRYKKNNIKIKKIINLPSDCRIDADPVQLSELLNNILNNSAEAMNKTPVRIEFFAECDKRKKHLKIRIRDNGLGIDKDILDKITDPFFTTKTKGTGLGLSVSRQIVELHGGKLDFKSSPWQGTEVSIKLPMKHYE